MSSRQTQTLHQRILDDIEQKILSGQWAPGHRLPAEMDLAKSYNCSRMTVNKVMAKLVVAGMIVRYRKSGSFVRMPQGQSVILPINDISVEVQDMGLRYSFEVLDYKLRPAKPAECHLFELDEGQNGAQDFLIIETSCLHFANNCPFCLEHRLINIEAVPEAEETDFSTILASKWLLESVPWSTANNQISAISANKKTAQLLKIKPQEACLQVLRLTRNDKGIVTQASLTYPGKSHTIEAAFTPLSLFK